VVFKVLLVERLINLKIPALFDTDRNSKTVTSSIMLFKMICQF